MDNKILIEKIETLQRENERLKSENDYLRSQLLQENHLKLETGFSEQIKMETMTDEAIQREAVNMHSSSEIKVKLYQSLFRGRNDICAKRWKNKPGYSPFCLNDFKEGVCHKPKVKCNACKNASFVPLDDKRIEEHLLGKYTIGLYPMTKSDTCFLLVMDFDEETYKEDVKAVLNVSRQNQIPAYAERSQSGNGCHIWFFFEGEVKATSARKFGMSILSLAMKECGSIRFSSYDRLFPSQDFLQKEGFGNLIALPLQKAAREKGNSVFVDEKFQVIKDQWAYLSVIKRVSSDELDRISKLFVTHSHSEEHLERDTDKKQDLDITDFPALLVLAKKRGLTILKQNLSPRALLLLRSIASYANPEFFAKQAMRQTTYGIPRYSEIYDEDEDTITLPRGCEIELTDTLKNQGIPYEMKDFRNIGKSFPITFRGNLDNRQEDAFLALMAEESGVLSATTGFGKTVIASRIIAEKSCSTLILVHTRELANQWKERLEEFLDIDVEIEVIKGRRKKDNSAIGMLGGGKNTIKGIVDIAIMQSLFETDKSVKKMVQNYGMVIADECHHVSAANFSRILSSTEAKYVYGLTATPIRKDGHHPVIFMHCGPIRYKVDAKREALRRDFEHNIIPRFTNIRMPMQKEVKEWHITDVYRHICGSEDRNKFILRDVLEAVEKGRSPLVLTERASHVQDLYELIKDKAINVIVLTGKLKSKERKEAVARISSLKDGEKFVLIATGKLVGEGFDVPRLDTLFLAMPIAWKGTITQYAGRLHRNYENKEEVRIYDYVDVHIPVLERMYGKRLSTYKSLGYSLRKAEGQDYEDGIFDNKNYLISMMDDMKNAQTSIHISSTFITRKRINVIKDTLLEKYRAGVRITVNIKSPEEYPEIHVKYMEEIIKELELIGIRFDYTESNHLKFMILDQKLIWYGGLDILSDKYSNDTIIRVKNETLANEMIGVLLSVKDNAQMNIDHIPCMDRQ